MNRFLLSIALTTGLCLSLSGTPSQAKIRALTLPQMMEIADNAIVGKIVERRAFRVDHPIDGPELYFTDVTVEGRSLVDGSPVKQTVTCMGGWIDEQQGCYASESPTDAEIAVGKEVVVFYLWTDNMGGDVATHAMVGGHGGLYEVTRNRRGQSIVLGRGGQGYAVSNNILLTDLDEEITQIASELQEDR